MKRPLKGYVDRHPELITIILELAAKSVNMQLHLTVFWPIIKTSIKLLKTNKIKYS